MTADAKIFRWPNIQKETEEKAKTCVDCMSLCLRI